MNKKMIIIKIILTLLLVLGLQHLGLFWYALSESIGCLTWPLWAFAYIFDISIMFFWLIPIMIYPNIRILNLVFLFILNIISGIWVFALSMYLFPEIFFYYL